MHRHAAVRAEPRADGAVRLRNTHAGLCLAIALASTAPDARALQWNCNNGREQDWL
jgi:hypothetical protein